MAGSGGCAACGDRHQLGALQAYGHGMGAVLTCPSCGQTLLRVARGAEIARRNRDAIFDLHARAIEYMERYASIPYAFGKFDFVLIPAFQFGGMEHAGKILYNASGLLLDESATQNQYLGRASVIAHETAHMWFGNLVTMRWFNDVWMKEVFANFMAAKIVNPSFPEVNHDLRFLLSHYPGAYDMDRTAGSNPIRQQLSNLSEAGQLYGAIIYQKAPIVMRHLEDLMGEAAFRDGLREYLKNHAFGNATWSDLIDVLDKRTPQEKDQLYDWWLFAMDQPSQQLHKKLGELQQEEVGLKSRGTVAHVMQERDGEPTAHVLFRGEYDKRREQLKAATPKALPPMPADPWWSSTRECGRAYRLPGVPADSRNCPALAATPIASVPTSAEVARRIGETPTSGEVSCTTALSPVSSVSS